MNRSQFAAEVASGKPIVRHSDFSVRFVIPERVSSWLHTKARAYRIASEMMALWGVPCYVENYGGGDDQSIVVEFVDPSPRSATPFYKLSIEDQRQQAVAAYTSSIA